MNTEYESLKEEIKAWQHRRFTLLSGSVALVIGILGLKMVGESKPTENWTWPSALLLALLAAACALTWYAMRSNAKIAAYLVVFHESPPNPHFAWESRLDALKKTGRDWWNLNLFMICIYLGLALLAVLAPWLSHQEYHLGYLDYVALTVGGGLFLVTLLLLGLPSPKQHFIKLWTQLKEKENKRVSDQGRPV